jgi:hypothetical protein
MFFTILDLLKGVVRGLRSETRIRDHRPDLRVRPRTGTVKRHGTAQHWTMDPASASGSAFRTVWYAAPFKFFFGALVKKLLGGRTRVQYSDPDLPRLIRSHPGTAFSARAMPTMEGTVQEDDYLIKVRSIKSIKHKNVGLLRFTQNRDLHGWRIRDSDPDLNPDPGLN